MTILEDIDRAAHAIKDSRMRSILPVARNFTIIWHGCGCTEGAPRYLVYSYVTEVARAIKHSDGSFGVYVYTNTFKHSTTTSRHVRRFLTAMVGDIDWRALYRECEQTQGWYINVAEFRKES